MTHLLNISSSAAPWLVVFPLVLPLIALGLAMLAWRRPGWQQAIGLATGAGLLGTAVLLLLNVGQGTTLATRVGAWPAPVGILLEADVLTALMLTLSAVMTMTTLIYSAGTWAGRPGSRFFIPLVMVTVLGVNGAFLTRDLFNLYVWFEVLLMGSFGVLVVTGGSLGREAALKSLTLNLIGSLVFLLAVGTVYGLAGTLDMYDLQQRLAQVHAERPHAVTGVAALLMMAFAVKAALFPFHFWLPASYHVPTAGICALFAALLTKVGIYSLLRILTLPFSAVQGLETILGVLAGLTMVVGVLGAVTQFEMKRILAWHSISQVGYMAVGLALIGSPAAEMRLAGLAATVFFIIHHGLVKPALFLLAGLVARYQGTTELKETGGLHQAQPLLAVGFLLAALSLAGIPPLSGFWAKLAVVQAALNAGQGWLVGAALGAGLITLLSMVKIWNEVFWKPRPDAAGAQDAPLAAVGSHRGGWVATWVLVGLVTLIGLYPRPLLNLSDQAATSLLEDRARFADPGGVRP